MMSGMQRFVDDDRGYLDWLDRLPDGFVAPPATVTVLPRRGREVKASP